MSYIAGSIFGMNQPAVQRQSAPTMQLGSIFGGQSMSTSPNSRGDRGRGARARGDRGRGDRANRARGDRGRGDRGGTRGGQSNSRMGGMNRGKSNPRMGQSQPGFETNFVQPQHQQMDILPEGPGNAVFKSGSIFGKYLLIG